MENKAKNIVDGNENVARILANNWFVKGILQQTAFTLRDNETYISVNRPSVASYTSDINSFVRDHKNFQFEINGDVYYQKAILNVDNIRNIAVTIQNQSLAIDVEVEPRDVFTKSHAGIFTRHGQKNIKAGSIITFDNQLEVSADMVLLKVRLALLRLSKVETCNFPAKN